MEATAVTKADFPDWLSPMLVKELRQGVRTRVFVMVFILLQVLLLVNTSLSLLVAAAQEDSTAGTVFFWLMVGLPLLVVLPLNGLNAVGGEIKSNTLELIFLTQLTPLRIIVGKWLAIFAQALLLACTVLPYLVLRYFIGGVNVSNDLEILGLMLAGSALLSACAIGISGYPTRIVRTLAGLFGLLMLFMGGSLSNFLFLGSSVLGPSIGYVQGAGLCACGGIVLIAMLEVGAAKIASPAENHSAVLRLLAFVALGMATLLGAFHRNDSLLTIVTFIIAVGLCGIAVCERPRGILSIFRPFAARGLPGRVVGKLLYPGWPSGVLFMGVVFIGFAGLMAYQGLFKEWAHFTEFLAVAGALLLPVALIRVFLPRARQPIALFFGVQLLCTLVSIFCGICDNVLRTHFKDVSALLPLCTLLMSIADTDGETAGRLAAVGFTTGASLTLLLVALRRPLREIRRREVESLQLSAPVIAHAPVA